MKLTLLPKLARICPKKLQVPVKVSATGLHCGYWANAALHEPMGFMTPVYVGLFLLTILAYLISEDKSNGQEQG